MVSVLNTLAIGSDRSKLIDYPVWIKNDSELSPRTRDFQLAVFGISVEQNTPCPLVTDQLIAEHMNLNNDRGIRRYRKISNDKKKMITIKGEQKGYYRLGFLYNPNSSIAQDQSVKLDDLMFIDAQSSFHSLSNANDDKPIKKSTPKPRAKNSGKSLPKPITQELQSTEPSSLIASTPKASAESLSTEASTPAPSRAMLSPIVTTNLVAELVTTEKQTETEIKQQSISAETTATNYPTYTPTILANSTKTNSTPNLSISTPQVSVFASALLAKREQDKLQAQAQELFYGLTQEQEQMLTELTILIEETWEKTNKLLELKRKWQQSKPKERWENFLSEKLDEQARLEATKQFLILDGRDDDESSKSLAIQNALDCWTTNQTTPETTTITIASGELLVNLYQNDKNETRKNDHDHQNDENTPNKNLVKVYQNNQQKGDQQNIVGTTQPQCLQKDQKYDHDQNQDQNLVKVYQNKNLVNLYQEQNPANSYQKAVKSSRNGQVKSGFSSIQSVMLNLDLGKLASSNQPTNTNENSSLLSFGKDLPKSYLATENMGDSVEKSSTTGITPLIFPSNTSIIPSSTLDSSRTRTSPSPTTTTSSLPSKSTKYLFKALKSFKAYSYSYSFSFLDPDPEKKEKRKSLSLRVVFSGTDSTSSGSSNSTKAITTSTTHNTTSNKLTDKYNQHSNNTNNNNNPSSKTNITNDNNSNQNDNLLIMQRFNEQQETVEGVIYNRNETITLPDQTCEHCSAKGRLFKLVGEGETKETPCICCRIYMLEPLVNERKKVLVGTPKLTSKELALQKELTFSLIDDMQDIDKSKVISISISDKVNAVTNIQANQANQPQTQFQPGTKSNAKCQSSSKSGKKLQQPQQLQENKEVTGKSVDSKESKTKSGQREKVKSKLTKAEKVEIPVNSAPDRMFVSKEEFPYIDELNQTAHLRVNGKVNGKGKGDIKILSSKCGKFWILPNPFGQQRKSATSFWEWLVYALRQPNCNQPIRLACCRYYLGNKEQEIQPWLKERANLFIGGSMGAINSPASTTTDSLTNKVEVIDTVQVSANSDLISDMQDDVSKVVADIAITSNFPLTTDYGQHSC